MLDEAYNKHQTGLACIVKNFFENVEYMYRFWGTLLAPHTHTYIHTYISINMVVKPNPIWSKVLRQQIVKEQHKIDLLLFHSEREITTPAAVTTATTTPTARRALNSIEVLCITTSSSDGMSTSRGNNEMSYIHHSVHKLQYDASI
jgi:hypothetical protein